MLLTEGFFRVGFFWDRFNTHQCSYVKTKGFIKTKSLPGQTEGLRVGFKEWVGRRMSGGHLSTHRWIGGRKDGYKGCVWF
jgi:hypothetical protein